MFLCFGGGHVRLQMSMQAVYSQLEMFEKASPHLKGGVSNLINRHGVLTPVTIVAGVALEFGPGLFTRIENADELWFASRLVVSYHDSLRAEAELVDIEENERSMYETSLLEEALLYAQTCEEGVGSDTEICDTRDGIW
jgi:hypothetical protein